MNILFALWVCSQPVNLSPINDGNSQDGYVALCANNFNHHQSSHLLYEQPISWPVREKLNKGIVKRSPFYWWLKRRMPAIERNKHRIAYFAFWGVATVLTIFEAVQFAGIK